MAKLQLDPNSPRTNFILGAALAGGDVMAAAQLARGATVERVGAGALSIIREVHVVTPPVAGGHDGQFHWTLTTNPTNKPLAGYGATSKEAAKHLADQLRDHATHRLLSLVLGSYDRGH